MKDPYVGDARELRATLLAAATATHACAADAIEFLSTREKKTKRLFPVTTSSRTNEAGFF